MARDQYLNKNVQRQKHRNNISLQIRFSQNNSFLALGYFSNVKKNADRSTDSG